MTSEPYHHGDLARQLIAHASAIVEAEGPGAVTVARVAHACGVSVAAPYRHFKNKPELLATVANEGFLALGKEFATAQRAGDTPEDRLIAAGMAYVSFADRHPGMFRLMFSLEERGRHPQGGPEALAALRALVEPLDLRVPVDIAVRTAWALVHGAATLRVSGMRTFTEQSEEELRAELAALITGLT